MQATSRIAVLAALASACAFADPPAAPTPSGQAPAVVATPPAPPELAPLSRDFQADMANSQLQTYRYNQLTEQAQALKKLCDTGFGPADICPKGNPASTGGGVASASAGLPTVAEIDGTAGALSAVLVFDDGRRLTVQPGSTLPNGPTVAAITSSDVRIETSPGATIVLSFGDRGQLK
jgi:type IV pilus biogenesis protein PilP